MASYEVESYSIEMQMRCSNGEVVRNEILLDPANLRDAQDAWKEFEAAAAMVWERVFFDKDQ